MVLERETRERGEILAAFAAQHDLVITNTKHVIQKHKPGRAQMVQLKTLDNISNCQRLVFTVGVSHYMYK